MHDQDTEANYRQHLALLISRTKSRGGTRYYNQFVNRCRDQAASVYPKGSAAANKKDGNAGFFVAILAGLFTIFGG